MQIYSAPMEGVTAAPWRRAHNEVFGGVDKYFAPFFSPTREHVMPPRVRRELLPANNPGFTLVPQLLCRDPDDFVWAARELFGMGYGEVNLNLGCPSGTVVAKGRGSGFLRDPDALEVFLQDVCARSPLPVSVKTRLGIADDAEYGRILGIYCRLPLKELIVHPRVQKDRYQGKPRWEAYGETLARAPFPAAYNGDICCRADLDALCAAYPQTRHVMLGRGILTNPALARELCGGAALTASELARFHDELYGAYKEEIGGNAVFQVRLRRPRCGAPHGAEGARHRRVRGGRRARVERAAAGEQSAIRGVGERRGSALIPLFDPTMVDADVGIRHILAETDVGIRQKLVETDVGIRHTIGV